MTTLNEQDFTQHCHDYFDGLMDEAAVEQFFKLMENNPTYQQIFQSFQAVHQQLQALPLETPPAHLESRILHAIEQEQQKVIRFPQRQDWFGAKAAAVLFIGLSVGALVYLFSTIQQDGVLIAENQQQHIRSTPPKQVKQTQQTRKMTAQERDMLLAEQLESLWGDIDTLYDDQNQVLTETEWTTVW